MFARLLKKEKQQNKKHEKETRNSQIIIIERNIDYIYRLYLTGIKYLIDCNFKYFFKLFVIFSPFFDCLQNNNKNISEEKEREILIFILYIELFFYVNA